MKKVLCILLVLIALGVQALADTQPAVLVADFSNQSPDAEELGLLTFKDYAYEGELTAQALAKGLSEWTGLDFFIADAIPEDNGITVAWAEDSTLIKGLDDRVQTEEFFFYDVTSLNWFMLDSLNRTIQENLNVADVYYTDFNGNPLKLPGALDDRDFPEDMAYMGSDFYEGLGDIIEDDEGWDGEDWGELGYDDEVEYPGRSELVETETILDTEDEYYQIGSDGSYIREKMTADGIVLITNRNFPYLDNIDNIEVDLKGYAVIANDGSDFDEFSGEAHTEIDEFTAAASEDYSAQTTYPSFLLKWFAGHNEDTRQNIALAVLTDESTLMYHFSVSIDHYEDYEAQILKVLDGLHLEYVE